MPKTKTVRIYPVPGVSLYPWRTKPQDVSESDWAELQKYSPQPFTDQPPGVEPEQPAEPAEQVGSPDSGGND